MFRWLRRVVERVERVFVREEPTPRRRRRKRTQPRPAPRRRVHVDDDFEPDFVEPEEPVSGPDPGAVWIDTDSEWYETDPDLIYDVFLGLVLDMEAGDYL